MDVTHLRNRKAGKFEEQQGRRRYINAERYFVVEVRCWVLGFVILSPLVYVWEFPLKKDISMLVLFFIILSICCDLPI